MPQSTTTVSETKKRKRYRKIDAKKVMLRLYGIVLDSDDRTAVQAARVLLGNQASDMHGPSEAGILDSIMAALEQPHE